ncbi:MAG TPA: hypothetical protein VEH30_12395 [Terriglobales bacterium]|nr:hypothetical protein [Terriglobales bacterium]
MRTAKRILLRTLLVLVIVWLGFVGVIFWAMHQPPEQFARVMSRMPGPAAFLLAPFETLWMRARAGVLNAGDPAPDFKLTKLDKSDEIQLSSLTSRQPVVLIFGSYT